MQQLQRKQAGFTLIELVVVIVILGILAATAIPRFADMSDQAKEASQGGVLGAVRSASSLVHAQALVENKDTSLESGESVTMEGDTIDLTYGYAATATASDGIALAVDADGVDVTCSAASGFCTWTLDSDDNCTVTYNSPTSDGDRPEITKSTCP